MDVYKDDSAKVGVNSSDYSPFLWPESRKKEIEHKIMRERKEKRSSSMLKICDSGQSRDHAGKKSYFVEKGR